MPEKRDYRVLIPLHGDMIAPRFDLATEIWLGVLDERGHVAEQRILVLPGASGEELCNMVVHEDVGTVVCCGIEQDYYDYLTWKKVRVVDSVIADWERAVEALGRDELKPGDVLVPRVTLSDE